MLVLNLTFTMTTHLADLRSLSVIYVNELYGHFLPRYGVFFLGKKEKFSMAICFLYRK